MDNPYRTTSNSSIPSNKDHEQLDVPLSELNTAYQPPRRPPTFPQSVYVQGPTYANDTPPTPVDSPFYSGPHVEESTGNELRATRSIRSMFSRRSHDRESLNEGAQDSTTAGSTTAPLRKTATRQAELEHALPMVLEESEEEEELPDIKEVIGTIDDTAHSSKSDLTQVEEKRSPRRGYHNIQRSGSSRRRSTRHTPNFLKNLRKFYIAILSRALITRVFIYWLPLAVIFFIPLAFGAWGNRDAAVGHTRIMWLFIWVEVVWGSLWISRVVAHYLPAVADIVLTVISPTWRKYTSIMRALEVPITYVFWAFVSFVSFIPLLSYNHHAFKGAALTQHWQKVVNNLLVALLVVSLVYLAERLVIHLMSVSFHKTRFAARIKVNKQSINTLTLLLKASHRVFPEFCEEFEDEDLNLESGGILQRGKEFGGFAKTVATNNNVRTVVGRMNRVVGTAANALGSVARDIRGSDGHSSTYRTVIAALESRVGAEILANRIWKSLVLEDSEELTIEDLVEVLGREYEAEAVALFETLDKDGNGGITLDETIQAVKEIRSERKTIYRSLRDMDSAIGKLHEVLMFIVLIIAIVIFIGMLAPSVGTVLATLGSSLLALSFVFSATAQEVLASCVFLFVKHPLDIGDMVAILINNVNTQMVVLEISLLYTVLRDNSTGVVRQASNAVLNTLWVDNLSRSGPMSAAFTLTLGLPETTAEDIECFKDKLDEFLEINKRDYLPKPYCQVTDYPELDRISLTISITYRNNFADGTLFGTRRTRVVKFLAECVNTIPLHIPRRDDTFSNPELPLFTTSGPRGNGGLPRRPFGFRIGGDITGDEVLNEAASQVQPEPSGNQPSTESAEPLLSNPPVESGEPIEYRPPAEPVQTRPRRSDSAASRVSRATTTLSRNQSTRGLRKRLPAAI